ncbi:extracellular matrix protein 1 isoform X2 [Trichomycterus rosablanca]|uniref:extracellular matrix protein 1 isoform X2 n=1 Tax=Trichomycterus rosablanca TaxID=2290929 RepID=UPI002F35C1B5
MDGMRAHLLLCLLLVVRAAEDPFTDLRDEIFTPLGPEFEGLAVQKPIESFLPIDLLDEWMQRTVARDESPAVEEKGPTRPPVSHQLHDYYVPFPLGRPTLNNIFAICHYSGRRSWYPKEKLPDSGFGSIIRQIKANNKLEYWFPVCCGNNSTQDEELTLCCAEQAWKESLADFCWEELSIKTIPFHCCKLDGSEIWKCFEKFAVDHDYLPTNQSLWTPSPSIIENFDFNPSTCKRTSIQEDVPEVLRERETLRPRSKPSDLDLSMYSGMEQRMVIPDIPLTVSERAPERPPVDDSIPIIKGLRFPPARPTASDILTICHRSISESLRSPVVRKLNIVFPPGRPTSANIASICTNRERRPLYPSGGLTGLGAHQWRAMDMLDKAFAKCCKEKTNIHACAMKKWKRMVRNFCRKEQQHSEKPFDCCGRTTRNDQYDCFAAASPNPGYTLVNVNFAALRTTPTSNMFCNTYTKYKYGSDSDYKFNEMAEECCSLPDGMKLTCIQMKLNNVCKNQQRLFCCGMRRSECLNKLLLRYMAASNILTTKGTICPMSFDKVMSVVSSDAFDPNGILS